MSERVRATLDDPELRARLRREHLGYVRRRPARPQPRLIDITLQGHGGPLPREPSVAYIKAGSEQPKDEADPAVPVSATAPRKPRATTSQDALRDAMTGIKSGGRGVKWLRNNKGATLLVGLAAIVFATGLIVSLGGWRTNQAVQAQVRQLSDKPSNHRPSSSISVPSTVKPSSGSIARYSVAADLPRYLNIPKIDVHARVLEVGVTKAGDLATPDNIYDTAWYNDSAKPGEPGAVLIDGHLDGYDAAGVFWNLHRLIAGDIIQIQRGDGTMFTYKVVRTQTYNSNDVDMQAAMTPVVTGKPGLNLITCDGTYIASNETYSQRLIVFTEQV